MLNYLIIRFLLCIFPFFLGGCSSGGGTRALANAATDPWTWVPLAGAAAIHAGEADQRLSDWAKTRAPVYGSKRDALRASDRFRGLASSSAWAAVFASTPEKDTHWLVGKSTEAAETMVGLMVARNTTGVLKAAAHRERPHNGPVHDSLPSAHSTDAFAHATVGRYHADRLPLAKPARRGVKWAMNTFALATAWGRVEGGVHYPTDVLIGAAVANFSTHLFLAGFGTDDARSWRVRPVLNADGFAVQIQKQF